MLVLAGAFALLRFLIKLIPPIVPSIEVDASDVSFKGSTTDDDSDLFIPQKNRVGYNDRVQCYEPATMKYLGCVPAMSNEEVRGHVKQARKAQIEWARSSFKQRRKLLRVLLKYILENQELICQVSSRDSGKTMVDAELGEIMTTCEKITWLLDEGERWLKPEYRSTGRAMLHKTARVEYHPLGVIGAIVPWNYPFHNIFNPMLASVFAGNAIVIKVSEHASWSGCFYLRIIHAALETVGVPANLVHIITGYAETGEALVSSVDKVIFVGSPGVGKKVMETASKTLTPVILELGGKDAFIVCDDVNASEVAKVAVRAALQSSGQNCAGAERFYVHSQIYSDFVEQIKKIVKSVRVGSPMEGIYDMGAVCLPEHTDRLHELVDDATDKGAEIAVRGKLFSEYGDDVGQFYLPTVILNVNHSMRLMQEEIFGPIIAIMKFNTDNEVVRLANETRFGLGCAVFSGNKQRANAIASQVYCGFAAINDFAATYMCQALPFGGVKDSGFGRFAGVEGLRACCLVKAVVEDRCKYIRTVIPKPLQYPVAENAFEFEKALMETLYSLNIWERLRAVVNLIKVLTAPESTRTA